MESPCPLDGPSRPTARLFSNETETYGHGQRPFPYREGPFSENA